eukprot:276792-Chlamydomonas_euryale.AAC.8
MSSSIVCARTHGADGGTWLRGMGGKFPAYVPCARTCRLASSAHARVVRAVGQNCEAWGVSVPPMCHALAHVV